MKSFVEFFMIIFYTSSLSLTTQGEELACSAQDNKPSRSKRSALSSEHPKWPSSIIPYYIACTDFNEKELHLIRTSLDEIQRKTCVKFVEMNHLGQYENYIKVECIPENGCMSKLGYEGRPQALNLQVYREHGGPNSGSCMSKRKIQHEFMHALGFQHEHNSPVRDQYVKILHKNIAEGWEYYFRKSDPEKFDSYGCPYDYDSIMQVDSYLHSKSKNLPVIKPLDQSIPLDKFGKAESVSECDIRRIKNMYCNVDVTSKDKVQEVAIQEEAGLPSDEKKSENGRPVMSLGTMTLNLGNKFSLDGPMIQNYPDLVFGRISPMFGKK